MSLRRVQNPANRERFLTQRATMVRACPPPVECRPRMAALTPLLFSAAAQADKTTAFLWHGSAAKSVELIAKSNLDPRLNGKNGIVYGKGAYLARTPATSLGFCLPGKRGGTLKMLLVKALIGRHKTRGVTTMVKPPQGFDSVVNNVQSPEIHVVFDMAQLYPAYVIEFDQRRR